MSAFHKRKNRVVLSDYPYQRDIEWRLLLANVSCIEVAILQELFHYSLEAPLADLSQALSLPIATITAHLAKFAPSKLFRIDGSSVIFDRERRRYLEKELAKFDPKFEPGMEYLQQLLQRVPLHVLPSWYALPKHCERIFPALVDKYLITPKIYQRYLQELQFPNPMLHQLQAAIFSAPNYKISGMALQKRFSLTAEQFHEALLNLEFHFVAALSYECRGAVWEEMVTPFHEWHQYLLFMQQSQAPPIVDISKIQRNHPRDFGFCEELTELLKSLPRTPCPLMEKALLMHLAAIEGETLLLSPLGEEWLTLEMPEKAMTMTRHPIQVERGLHRVLHSGWVYVDDFLRGFTGVLRGKEPLALTQLGKRWKYLIPRYNEEEQGLIRTTLYRRLYEAGIVATGTCEGRECFCVTPFGVSLF